MYRFLARTIICTGKAANKLLCGHMAQVTWGYQAVTLPSAHQSWAEFPPTKTFVQDKLTSCKTKYTVYKYGV